MNKKLTRFLYSIIFIAGYLVLSSELIAMELVSMLLGGGTDSVSIIIAAILMSLAFGYYYGGQYVSHHKQFNIREKLINNILISLLILGLGLSVTVIEKFFLMLHFINLHSLLINTTIYSGVFIVYPMFLLGEFTPLISNYFSKTPAAEVAGSTFFMVTIGSCLGSIITAVVLIPMIGVHATNVFNIFLFVLLLTLLSRKYFVWRNLVAYLVMILTILI